MESGVAMRDVWIAAGNTFTPLGDTTQANYQRLLKGHSGVSRVHDPLLSEVPVFASAVRNFSNTKDQTRLERMCLHVLQPILEKFSLPSDRTVFILSTTKGNISALDGENPQVRLPLHETTAFVADIAGFKDHLTVSNACISGVLALVVAKRLLNSEKYDHALVIGADELSRFVIGGFQSLQALSGERCKPFDSKRNGLNLGEASAALLLTSRPEVIGANPDVRVLGCGLSNDANHISGPSRTGEELGHAIKTALRESRIQASDLDFISAHGTATIYNDEMEAKAFHVAGVGSVPVHSLKAYFGHTLGAAGVLETALGIESLKENRLIPSLGFETAGVSKPLKIIGEAETKPLRSFLKTASGFGGCNAAIVFQKVNSI
jgi:3-oxoacyl-[acyl-carrier-protein] synthase I